MIRIFLLILAVSLPLVAHPQDDRSIKSNDFTDKRPKAKRRTGPPAKSTTYHQASPPLAKPIDKSSPSTLKVGITIWKVERVREGESFKEVPRRVEADTRFHEGDLLRLRAFYASRRQSCRKLIGGVVSTAAIPESGAIVCC